MGRTIAPPAPVKKPAPAARAPVRAPMRRSMAERMQRHTTASVGKGNSSLELPQGLEIWRPDKPGNYEMDFLPYLVTKAGHPDEIDLGEEFTPGEDTWYRRPYAVHYLEQRRIICPRFTFGLPCPICEANDALRKEDYSANEAAIKELNPKKNVLFVVRLKGDKVFKLFDWNNSKFADVLEKEMNNCGDASVFSFAELVGGKTVTIRIIEETYKGKKFNQCNRIDFKVRGDIPATVLDKVPKLDELFRLKTYEEIARIFSTDDDSGVVTEEETASRQQPPLTEEEAGFKPADVDAEWGGEAAPEVEAEEPEEPQEPEAPEEEWGGEAEEPEEPPAKPAPKAAPAKAPVKPAPAAKAPPAKPAPKAAPAAKASDDDWD